MFALFRMTAAALILSSAPALAEEGRQFRIRGVVAAYQDGMLAVKPKDGEPVQIPLGQTSPVLVVSPLALDEVKVESYVGVASEPQPDGSMRALALVMFPEGARGMYEGASAWDLTPQSRMTNATVMQVVAQAQGRELTVKYQGDKTERIVIPVGIPVATFIPGDRGDLAPGANVVVFAVRGPDEAPRGGAVMVGKDGFTPPF